MPTFDYNLDIPAGPNNPSNDQPLMQINTNSIDSIIGVDHYTFETTFPVSSIDGFHKQVTLPQSPSAPVGASGQDVLYSFAGTSGTELHIVRDGTVQTDAVLTSSDMIVPVAATNGYTYLAGPGTGVTKGATILQWGTNTAVTSGSFASGAAAGTVNFLTSNIAFPKSCFAVYTIPFYANATPPNGAASVNVASDGVIRTAFNWKFNSNSSQYTGFYWFAIGN